MCSLAAWAATNDIDSVAMPKIGAGLGKLDWVSDVIPMYEEYLAFR
jgi:O-acetyl-ADP-ribose deacetylase (regulator of RNase III)